MTKIRSKSNPDREYEVTLDPDHCTCEGFRWRQTCTHLEVVRTTSRRPAPMLAKPLPEDFDPRKPRKGTNTQGYVVEEKLDGHRLLVRVLDHTHLVAWSRTGKDSMRKLSPKLQESLLQLPDGVYDGELVTRTRGEGSSDVAKLENRNSLTYVIFDSLELVGQDITSEPYTRRRTALEMIFDALALPHVQLTASHSITTRDELDRLAGEIWKARGEGVIVKRVSARYEPGKRRDAFMKLKKCQTAVLEIIGWEEGTTGPYCVATLRDEDGNVTGVKALDDVTRQRINKAPESFLGRMLRIEYHERTADGSYRHPRWDRLEDE